MLKLLPETPCRVIRSGVITVIAAVALAAFSSPGAAQLPRVGIIDLYGLHKTSPQQVREALGINVGDSLTSIALLQMPAKLAALPGVASASVDPV